MTAPDPENSPRYLVQYLGRRVGQVETEMRRRVKALEERVAKLNQRLYNAGVIVKELQDEVAELKNGDGQ